MSLNIQEVIFSVLAQNKTLGQTSEKNIQQFEDLLQFFEQSPSQGRHPSPESLPTESELVPPTEEEEIEKEVESVMASFPWIPSNKGTLSGRLTIPNGSESFTTHTEATVQGITREEESSQAAVTTSSTMVNGVHPRIEDSQNHLDDEPDFSTFLNNGKSTLHPREKQGKVEPLQMESSNSLTPTPKQEDSIPTLERGNPFSTLSDGMPIPSHREGVLGASSGFPEAAENTYVEETIAPLHIETGRTLSSHPKTEAPFPTLIKKGNLFSNQREETQVPLQQKAERTAGSTFMEVNEDVLVERADGMISLPLPEKEEILPQALNKMLPLSSWEKEGATAPAKQNENTLFHSQLLTPINNGEFVIQRELGTRNLLDKLNFVDTNHHSQPSEVPVLPEVVSAEKRFSQKMSEIEKKEEGETETFTKAFSANVERAMDTERTLDEIHPAEILQSSPKPTEAIGEMSGKPQQLTVTSPEQFAQDVNETVRIQLKKGPTMSDIHKVHIQLTPEELGPMDIQIEWQQEHTSVSITVENKAVKELLESRSE